MISKFKLWRAVSKPLGGARASKVGLPIFALISNHFFCFLRLILKIKSLILAFQFSEEDKAAFFSRICCVEPVSDESRREGDTSTQFASVAVGTLSMKNVWCSISHCNYFWRL